MGVPLYQHKNKTMYTATQLKAIYQALRGLQAIGKIADEVGMNRIQLKEQFYPTLETNVNPEVYKYAVGYLKSNGILADIQTLTEILN
jgi:AraC-like DNA-binding protein